MEMNRDEFFGMAGLTATAGEGAYTPVSVGKGAKIRNGNASWIASLKRADFVDATGLRALTPEPVSEQEVFVNNVVQKDYKAIVGNNTNKVYSIKSNRYIPVQNQLMVESLAQVSDNTGIQVFGTLRDEGGKMGINAFFADPDCNVDFGAGHSKDPYMLGVRAYNSHTGSTGFGAHIVGVRWMCSNMCSFGETLGQVSWKHFVTQDKVVDLISGMIEGYMDRVPVLKDRIEALRNTEVSIVEAENLIWGIRMNHAQIEGIMTNLNELNPEIKGGKMNAYDVYNVVTAYNSYANTGGSEFRRVTTADRAEKLFTASLPRLIDQGIEIKQKWEEAQAIKEQKRARAEAVAVL